MKYDACVDCGVEKTGRATTPRCRSCAMRLRMLGKPKSPEQRRAMSLAKGGPASTPNFQHWALLVKERDCWRCICGYQGAKGKTDVDAHHIVPKESSPWGASLHHLVENGITLCRSCHRRVHRKSRPAAPALALLYDTAQQLSQDVSSELSSSLSTQHFSLNFPAPQRCHQQACQ